MNARDVVHEIADGFCVKCGDTVEWLTDRGGQIVEVAQNAEPAEDAPSLL